MTPLSLALILIALWALGARTSALFMLMVLIGSIVTQA